MNWFLDNLAVISGVFVPVLLGVIGPLMAREKGSRRHRRIRRIAELRNLLADSNIAVEKVDELIEIEVEQYVEQSVARATRSLDGANLAAIIVVALIGGGFSFGLVTGAQAATGFWSGVLWVVFIGWTVFVIGLVLVGGLANLYKTTDSDRQVKFQ